MPIKPLLWSAMGHEELSLDGHVAVVVGGTSGLGKEIAAGLKQAGATVAVTGRREHLVTEINRELAPRGASPLCVACDVLESQSVDHFRDRCLEHFGQVHILVNCAGITQRTPTLKVTDEDFRRVLEVNLMGTLRTCRAFGESMVDKGYGRIVNTASLSSFVALFEVAAYSASKAAVASLTQSLAVEWGKSGVCVNAIAPGVFPTELNRRLLDGTPRGQEFIARTPLGRFGVAKELVGATVFLASPAASFTNGAIIPIDGGFLASGVNQ